MKKAKLIVEGQDDNMEDEVELFIKGRFLCAMDAMWRVFGFQTYPASHPSCVLISIRSKKFADYTLSAQGGGKITDIGVYLNRPEVCIFNFLYFIIH